MQWSEIEGHQHTLQLSKLITWQFLTTLSPVEQELLLHVGWLRDDVLHLDLEVWEEDDVIKSETLVPCVQDPVGLLVLLSERNQTTMVTNLVDVGSLNDLEPIVPSITRQISIEIIILRGLVETCNQMMIPQYLYCLKPQ